MQRLIQLRAVAPADTAVLPRSRVFDHQRDRPSVSEVKDTVRTRLLHALWLQSVEESFSRFEDGAELDSTRGAQ